MPKVSKHRNPFSIAGDKDAPFVLDIYYSKGEFFFKDEQLPKGFLHTTSFTARTTATSERELIAKLNAAFLEYKKLTETGSLVIRYHAGASTPIIMNNKGDGQYSGYRKGISSKFENFRFNGDLPSCTIGFHFEVFYVVKDGTGASTYYRYNTEKEEIGYRTEAIHRSGSEIPYTKERLEWFENLKESMVKMAVSMSTFFGASEEQAKLFIDSQQKLIE